MGKAKVVLPSVISEDCWFYKEHEELCKPHIGKPYISYSTLTAWVEYRDDLIKQKFAGIKIPGGVYAELGSYLGEAVENGFFAEENPHGFTGQENFELIERPEGAEYERMILIDFGDFVLVGFIDILHEYEPKTVHVRDLKSGGKGKEKYYASKEYIQVILYAYALELEGYKIGKTDVWFVRRTGSHFSPPLHISDEQFAIPLVYDEERKQFAIKKVKKVVKELSSCYSTYLKIFA
jgi:hypothetical protein